MRPRRQENLNFGFIWTGKCNRFWRNHFNCRFPFRKMFKRHFRLLVRSMFVTRCWTLKCWQTQKLRNIYWIIYEMGKRVRVGCWTTWKTSKSVHCLEIINAIMFNASYLLIFKQCIWQSNICHVRWQQKQQQQQQANQLWFCWSMNLEMLKCCLPTVYLKPFSFSWTAVIRYHWCALLCNTCVIFNRA